MKVAAVGECTIDRYVEKGIECVGGISLNFAVNAKHLGAAEVALVSCTGTDAAATKVRARLDTAGVDTRALASLPGRTASQVIHLGADAERIFPPGGYDAGVLERFRLDDATMSMLRGADVVACSWFRQIAELVAPLLDAHDPIPARVVDLLDGADLGTDLARVDTLLDCSDIAFISGGEELAERLLPRSRRSRSLIVVTHGSAGSSALLRGERLVAPAVPVPPSETIDSTGCGDAFQAAFTLQYLRNGDVRAALEAGARRAALVLRHLGATLEDE